MYKSETEKQLVLGGEVSKIVAKGRVNLGSRLQKNLVRSLENSDSISVRQVLQNGARWWARQTANNVSTSSFSAVSLSLPFSNDTKLNSRRSKRNRPRNLSTGMVASNSDSCVLVAASAAEPVSSITPTRRFLGNMAAGGVAGVCVEAILFPLDTIKTRLQAGMPMDWSKIYKGLPATLFAFPASALFFGVYEPVKTHLAARVPENASIVSHFGAAAAAGVAASLIRVPSEVVKQRMQTGEFKTLFGAIKGVVAQQGVRRGLYAGYGSLMLRDLPFDVIEFVAYEQLKLAGKKFVGDRELNNFEMAGVGAVAGAVTGFLTTPPDVLKTRLMTQGTTGMNGKVYKGIVDCAVRMVREEGTMSLFKGCAPRVMWITLGGSIFFGTLERGI